MRGLFAGSDAIEFVTALGEGYKKRQLFLMWNPVGVECAWNSFVSRRVINFQEGVGSGCETRNVRLCRKVVRCGKSLLDSESQATAATRLGESSYFGTVSQYSAT